jgi:hypothetical protein
MALSQMYRVPRDPCRELLRPETGHNPSSHRVDFQSCILCPNEGGAFKQTITGEWVHLLCAIWVPETRVANEVFMEPITGVDRISKQRWKLVRLAWLAFAVLWSLISSLSTLTEMLDMRYQGGRLYSVREDIMFPGISCYLCTEAEASYADEEFPRCRACSVDLLLREAPACVYQPFSVSLTPQHSR